MTCKPPCPPARLSERCYTRRVLPIGLAPALREAAHGDFSGGLRGFAIAAGFTVVVIGFLMGHRAVGVQTVRRQGMGALTTDSEDLI